MSADNILREYWNGLLPIDPLDIAQRMGIKTFADGLMPYDGHYVYDENGPQIFYNPNMPAVRQRFTIAHELGHHDRNDLNAPRDTRDSFNTRVSDPREVGANQFAAALLMPSEQIEVAIYQRGINDIERLAHLFFVSQAAMEFRLKNIGIL